METLEAKKRRLPIASLITAALLAALALPEFAYTYGASLTWFQVHRHPATYFYMRWWFGGERYFIAGFGALVLLTAILGARSALRGKGDGHWLVFALALPIALFGVGTLPNFRFDDFMESTNHLSAVAGRLDDWHRARHTYPLSAEEFAAAAGDVATEQSGYMLQGKPLNFETEVLTGQAGAYQAKAPGRPGIVYYAVNASGDSFWLTVSGLNLPVSDHVVMKDSGPGVRNKPLILSRVP